ncbi:MAG: hypothetical protein ACYTDY_14250, partial [Planctomycetota bacterium]
MARRRSRPSRDRWEEAAPVAQPVEAAPLEFAEPQRPARGAGRGGGRPSGRGGGGGGMLGIAVPLVTAILATACVIIGGFIVASNAKNKMSRIFDLAGMNAAIALSAAEPEWWEDNHGLTRGLYETFVEKKNKRKKDERKKPDWDERNDELIEREFKGIVDKWGLDPNEMDVERDNLIRSTNRARLTRILPGNLPGSGILYASIRPLSGSPTRTSGGSVDPASGDRVLLEVNIGGTMYQVTSTVVYVGNSPARLYMAPIKNRYDKVTGHAEVAIDIRPLNAASSGLSNGALIAGLIALLVVGGVAFALCMGPAKGISQLTRDVEQIARGDLDTRVSARAGGEVGTLARMVERAMKTFRAVQEQSIAQATAQPVAAVAAGGDAVDTSTLLPSEPP